MTGRSEWEYQQWDLESLPGRHCKCLEAGTCCYFGLGVLTCQMRMYVIVFSNV